MKNGDYKKMRLLRGFTIMMEFILFCLNSWKKKVMVMSWLKYLKFILIIELSIRKIILMFLILSSSGLTVSSYALEFALESSKKFMFSHLSSSDNQNLCGGWFSRMSLRQLWTISMWGLIWESITSPPINTMFQSTDASTIWLEISPKKVPLKTNWTTIKKNLPLRKTSSNSSTTAMECSAKDLKVLM